MVEKFQVYQYSVLCPAIAVWLQKTSWLRLDGACFHTMYLKEEFAYQRKLSTYLEPTSPSPHRREGLLEEKSSKWQRKHMAATYICRLGPAVINKYPTKGYHTFEDNQLPEIG